MKSPFIHEVNTTCLNIRNFLKDHSIFVPLRKQSLAWALCLYQSLIDLPRDVYILNGRIHIWSFSSNLLSLTIESKNLISLLFAQPIEHT